MKPQCAGPVRCNAWLGGLLIRRPLTSGKLSGQLFGINWIKQTLVASFVRFEFGFGGANDQPKDFRFSVIEDLA